MFMVEGQTAFPHQNQLKINYEFEFIIEDGSSEKITNYLNSEKIHILLEKIDKDMDNDSIPPETTVQIHRENLVDAANENMKFIKTFKNGNFDAKETGEWFDLECKTLKKAIDNCRKSYRPALNFNYERERIASLCNDNFNARKMCKKLTRRKHKFFQIWKKINFGH